MKEKKTVRDIIAEADEMRRESRNEAAFLNDLENEKDGCLPFLFDLVLVGLGCTVAVGTIILLFVNGIL